MNCKLKQQWDSIIYLLYTHYIPIRSGAWQSTSYSCLENPKDRATWWDTIHTIALSRTRLKRLSSSSIYLLECPTSRILTIPHTVKIGNAHSLLVGMQVVQSFWKTVWQFLTKLNILLLYNPATMLLDIYPKWILTTTQKSPYMNAYSNLIHNCQNLEVIKIPFTRLMDKQTVVHLSIQWDIIQWQKQMSHQTTKRHKETQMHFTKWKKPIWKGSMVSYMIFWKGKTMEKVTRSVIARWQRGRV